MMNIIKWFIAISKTNSNGNGVATPLLVDAAGVVLMNDDTTVSSFIDAVDYTEKCFIKTRMYCNTCFPLICYASHA